MAGGRADESAIAMLEDAVQTLRQAPIATLACHWVGSAPMALAMVLFWQTVTNPRSSDAACAAQSLLLTALLVWMNCWRAVFAGRLRAQLGGAADARWTRERMGRLAATQAFVSATKLLALPVALLTMFPLADTVAFYRTSTVLAGYGDLDIAALITRSRQLAQRQTRQSWLLLPLLAFLGVVVALNLAITIGILPQAVRMLTGYESAFSRSGIYFVFNPVFVLLVLAASWMVFDPLIQAVYCVRCFRAESVDTGEDLRTGLRRIVARAGALAGLALLLGTGLGTVRAAVAPEDLKRAVEQSMQAPAYNWRLPPPVVAPSRQSWVVRVTDQMIAAMRAVLRSLGDALKQFFRWLRKKLGGGMDSGQGTAPAQGLHWSIYVLIALAVVAAAWVAWQKRRAWRRRPVEAAAAGLSPVQLEAEELSPDRLPEEQWLELAERCLAERNYRHALRALYLANLAWLGQREFLTIHAGKTNREYELELRRRAREFPDALSLFAANVIAFERAWYGLYAVAPEEVHSFRERVSGMKSQLPAPREAAA